MCGLRNQLEGADAPRQRGPMRSRRLFLGMACLGVAAATAIASATAQRMTAVAPALDQSAKSPSLLGSYLAGRFASEQRDTAAAADFYSRALSRDPGNEVLIEQTF